MHFNAAWRYLALLMMAVSASAVPASRVEAAGPDLRLTRYPGGKWSPPPPTHGVAAIKNVQVTVRDGTKLPVDIYFPTDKSTGRPSKGKFPVLLTRFWYTKPMLEGQSVASQDPEYFVSRGFVYVSADVRGTGRSVDTGAYLGEQDALDGVDLVNWTLTLPASNGIVGLIGCSAMGQTQLSTAAMLGAHSPVKAMIPACVPGDQYRDTYTENGVWRPTWSGLLMSAPAIFGTGMVSELTRVYLESQQGGDAAFDGKWWAQRNFVMQAMPIVETGAAVLLWNGWQDVGYGGLEVFAALQNAAFHRSVKDPLWPGMPVSGKYQLILGNWRHGEGLDKGIQLQWFETWLKGVDTGLPTTTPTPIHVQDRVTGEWFNHDSFPMLDQYTPLYLGAAELVARPPSPGIDTLRWELRPGTALEYKSAVFDVAARLAGPIGVRLNASSSTSDAQFRFELLDLAPDGTKSIISHGMILGSMHALDPARTWRDRQGNPVRPFSLLRNDDPIKPGSTIAYEVLLQPTMWTIQPNHRLVLVVATGPEPGMCPLFPMLGGQTDVGCTLRSGARDRLAGSSYKISRGGTLPSLVNLPLAPVSELQAVRSGPSEASKVVLPLDW